MCGWPGIRSSMHSSWYRFPIEAAFLLLIAVLLLIAGQVGAQSGSCEYYAFSPTDRYVEFDSDNYISGSQNYYSDNHCTEVESTFTVPGDGWVLLDVGATEADAVAACEAALGGSNNVLRERDLYPSEFSTFNERVWRCASIGGGRYTAAKRSTYIRKRVYIPPTGVTLNQTDLSLTAVDGLDSGIQFQRVDAAGVGIPYILEMGFLDAVDVWSNIGGGYEVCFPQIGRIVFLDAATSPRTVSMDVAYEYRDGYTCAAMDRAGTLVLVHADESANIPTTLEQPLSNCAITTTRRLNLRHAANGAVVQQVIPANRPLTPSARTQSWFRVVYAQTGGWVSERFVSTEGDCAYQLTT